MSVVLARIDNRLIHGQVLEAWIPHVHADCIMVANDQVAAASLQRVLMEAAVPRGIKVMICPVAEAGPLLAAGELDRRRVLLLFANSADALKAHRLGAPFDLLNLGNLHGGAGKIRLSCTIALDREDIEHLESLEREGVQIVSQCIPTDRGQDWRKLLPAAGNGHGRE